MGVRRRKVKMFFDIDNDTLANSRNLDDGNFHVSFIVLKASETQQRVSGRFKVTKGLTQSVAVGEMKFTIYDPHSEFHTFDCRVNVLYESKGYESNTVQHFGITPVLGGLQTLLGDENHSDFAFNVSGKVFNVHRCIMSLASPVFGTMFDSDDEEGEILSEWTLNHDSNIFDHLIKFIYTGKLPENFADVALDLYELAHLYKIKNLMDYCLGHILAAEIIKEKALDLYEYAKKYDIVPLHERCWTFIKM